MKITKEQLKQIIKEKMSSVLEEKADGTREASPEEIKTLIDNSGDSFNYERGGDIQTSFIEVALDITIIARTANKIYVQPGYTPGHRRRPGLKTYILGKLL